jgi:pilus assembly protein Flp/PilA
MKNLNNFVTKFRKDESGAAMIEYTILTGIIAVAVIASVLLVGTWVSGKWGKLAAELAKSPV